MKSVIVSIPGTKNNRLKVKLRNWRDGTVICICHIHVRTGAWVLRITGQCGGPLVIPVLEGEDMGSPELAGETRHTGKL